jgi:hypothetical protein
MNYEKKYLKYKIKYLKLVSKQQTGGKQLVWPTNSNEIKPDNKVKVIEVKVKEIKSGSLLSEIEINRLKNIATEEHYFTVRDPNPSMLRLFRNPNDRTGQNEYDFSINYFEKIVLDKAEEQESKMSNEKKEESLIEKKIQFLEEKLNNLERNLKGHYHILPTSGAKGYEDGHPYFPRNN